METKITQAFIRVSVLQQAATGWFFATYVLFLLDHGLSLFQANLVNLVFMCTTFLLNPYTGTLADKLGGKRVYIWGQIAWSVGMLVYGLSDRFEFFLLAEICAGIGSASMTGALDSWMRSLTHEETAHRTVANSLTFSTLATIPTAFLGGIIGDAFGRHWPWLAGSLSGALVALFSWHELHSLPETNRHGLDQKPTVKEAVKLTWHVGSLRFAAILAFATALSFQPYNMFWAPVFKGATGGSNWLGLMWLGIAVATATGSYLSHQRSLHINGLGIPLALALTGLPMAFAPGISRGSLLVAVFLLHETGRGALSPILFTYRNRHIEDRIRSTANSVSSSATTLGSAVGLLATGALTLLFPPQTIWGISAGALILLSLYAYRKVS